MNSGYVALTIAIMLIAAAVMVVAAFYDRRRGRQIAHDPSRLPDGLAGRLDAEARAHRRDRGLPRAPGP